MGEVSFIYSPIKLKYLNLYLLLMKFVVEDEELKDFIRNHYETDFAEKILEQFDYFRTNFDEQLAYLDSDFYEIFDYCVGEAIEAVRTTKHE